MGAGQTASEAESVTPVKSNPIYLEPSGELYRRNRSPLSASRHRHVNLKLQESILESAHRKEQQVVEVSNSSAEGEPANGVASSQIDVEPVSRSKWYRWRRDGKALIAYLLDSEVHTYAFSVSANAIISFIPFIVLLYTLSGSVFHSNMMVMVVGDMVHYFLPSNQEFVAASLAAAAPHHGVQLLSLVMILISCTGIFLPLEVALNQAWGVPRSRNYLFNQLVAFGLALLMVTLALISILLNAFEQSLLTFI